MSKNDANVSWNALMIHVDSLSVMSSAMTRRGMAEKSAELLTASKNCARQNMSRRTYRRAAENRWGTRPSTSVWAGERTVEGSVDFGGGSILRENLGLNGRSSGICGSSGLRHRAY